MLICPEAFSLLVYEYRRRNVKQSAIRTK